MNIGVFATLMSPRATPEMIGDFGRRAEDAGVESLWMGEHVVLFDEMEFPYPGSADGRIPVPDGGGMLDTVSTFGFLAASTRRLRLATGIALVPQRNPIYSAKEIATLDWLTGGRIDFGIGIGWCKEEVLACGVDWEDRGRRCDEYLELMKRLWTEPVVTFEGTYAAVKGCRLDPKPVQKPHVPIVVGGHSPRALRRAAEHGQGWYGFGLDVDLTRSMLDGLDAALAAAGRSRDGFEIVVTPREADEETIRRFQDLGVDRLVLHLGSQRPEAIDRRLLDLERFASLVA